MSTPNPLRLSAAALSALMVFSVGCKSLKHAEGFQTTSAVSASLHVTSYPLTGMVLAKSEVTHQVMIRQAAIPGYMPAADAAYTLKPSAIFDQLQPGDQIKADVIVPADGSYNHLTSIVVTSAPSKPMTLAELPPHPLLVGENVPTIAMTNQDNQPTALTDYRGKAVLITFVDSECTDDCPVITRMFAHIGQILSKNPEAYAKSHLITISIDPAHDTPAVLRRYGLKYLDGNANGFKHWEFVHMTPENLKRLATDFDVSYRPIKGDIEHTMDITLIGPNGEVVRSWSGDDWNAEKIAAFVAASATNKPLPEAAVKPAPKV